MWCASVLIQVLYFTVCMCTHSTLINNVVLLIICYIHNIADAMNICDMLAANALT